MIADHLTELIETLDRLTSTMERFWKDRCVEIVKRNSELSTLPHADKDGLRLSVHRMVLDGAATDGLDELVVDGIKADIWGCQGIVKDAAHELMKQMEVAEGEHQATKSAAQMLQTKVRALEERRREHAIHSPRVRQQVWDITGGKCIYCDVELTRERDPSDPQRCFEVDHIVAKTNGGPDHLSNYVPACNRCNVSKSNKSVFQFLLKRNASPDLKVVGGSEA